MQPINSLLDLGHMPQVSEVEGLRATGGFVVDW